MIRLVIIETPQHAIDLEVLTKAAAKPTLSEALTLLLTDLCHACYDLHPEVGSIVVRRHQDDHRVCAHLVEVP